MLWDGFHSVFVTDIRGNSVSPLILSVRHRTIRLLALLPDIWSPETMRPMNKIFFYLEFVQD